MLLRIFCSILLLTFSVGSSVYAQNYAKKIQQQTTSTNKKDTLAPFKGFSLNISWDSARHFDADSNEIVSFFIPLVKKTFHYVWWDTGTLYFDTRFGYRQLLSNTFNQDCFWGIYVDRIKYLSTLPPYRPIPNNFLNIGAEFGTSHFGQLNINFYGVPHSNPGNFDDVYVPNEHGGKSIPIKFLDKWGVSTQFSYRFKRLQGALFISRSNIWTLQKNERYYPEIVWNVGVGTQYYLSASFNIRVKCTLFDKYQQGRFSVKIRYGRGDNNLSSDVFQGRLNRPPEIYKTRYATRTVAF